MTPPGQSGGAVITFGITRRVMVGLFAIALLLAFTIWLGLSMLSTLRGGLLNLSTRELPQLMAAAELVRESEKLLTLTPDILVAQTPMVRNNIVQHMQLAVAHKEQLLAELNHSEEPWEALERLSRQYDRLVDNLSELAHLSDELHELELHSERIYRRLTQLAQELNGAALQSLEEDLERRALNAALATLFATRFDHGESELTHHRRRVERLLQQAHSAPPRRSSKRGRHQRGYVDELASYTQGEHDLFALRQQQLTIKQRVEQRLNQSKFLAEALLDQAQSIFATAKDNALNQEQRLDRRFAQFYLGLISAIVLLFSALFALYLFVRRSLLTRILGLRSALLQNLGHRRETVPTEGNDEITEMAHAMNYFIAAIDEHEQRLQRVLKRAEVANHAKSVFLANMSHEIRTPLHAILGFSELLAGATLSQQEQHYLSVIRLSGQSLLELISDILDLSRIEAGKLRIDYGFFHLERMLDEVCSLFEYGAADKGLSLRIELEQPLPEFIYLDQKRLRQVLFNLMGNAVKFTRHGRVSLSARARWRLGEEAVDLTLQVSDTGVGMEPQHLELIFEPFEQIDGPERVSQSGTGLGLAISRQLVEMMAGEIRVSSTPGQGSIFTVEIPALRVSSQANLPSSERPPMLPIVQFAPATVLVVDELPLNCALLRAQLESAGLSVIEANSGADALDAMRMQGPDLLLIDIDLPDIDGKELIARLHALQGSRHAALILVSARALGQEESELRQLGDSYLRKPIERRELLNEIRRFLPGRELSKRLLGVASDIQANHSTPLSAEGYEAILDAYERLEEYPSVNRLQGFILQLQEISAVEQIPALVSFIGELEQQTASFNMHEVHYLLESLPERLDQWQAATPHPD